MHCHGCQSMWGDMLLRGPRSWYIGLFQWPWLPELMMRSYDYAFVDAAFAKGPMACKTPGAVGPDHIAHFKQGLRQPYACTAALNYYRAFVDSTTRFPDATAALLSRPAPTLCCSCSQFYSGSTQLSPTQLFHCWSGYPSAPLFQI